MSDKEGAVEAITPDTFVAEDEDILVFEDEEAGKKEEAPVEVQEKHEPEVKPAWLPNKFKTPEDLAKSYEEAEKQMTKKEQEAAEYKKMVDTYILSSLPQKKQEETEFGITREFGLDGNVFSDDVRRAMLPLLEPLVREISEMRGATEQDKVWSGLGNEHREIVQTQEFAEWAKAKFSARTLQLGDSDPDVARDIVNAYKSEQKQPAPRVIKQKPVFTEKASAPMQSKVWSRRELIELQQASPGKYADMADEIYAAYAEGRVK